MTLLMIAEHLKQPRKYTYNFTSGGIADSAEVCVDYNGDPYASAELAALISSQSALSHRNITDGAMQVWQRSVNLSVREITFVTAGVLITVALMCRRG